MKRLALLVAAFVAGGVVGTLGMAALAAWKVYGDDGR